MPKYTGVTCGSQSCEVVLPCKQRCTYWAQEIHFVVSRSFGPRKALKPLTSTLENTQGEVIKRAMEYPILCRKQICVPFLQCA